MAKIGNVTNQYLLISFLKSKLKKKIIFKGHFSAPYFELLPWQRQLRHEFEDYLKTCPSTKCIKSANFNSIVSILQLQHSQNIRVSPKWYGREVDHPWRFSSTAHKRLALER